MNAIRTHRYAVSFCALFFMALCWWAYPVAEAYWYQDRCGFGDVSNEEYREMLAYSKRDAGAALTIGGVGNPGPNIASQLRLKILSGVANAKDYAGAVAAMHAAMRSVGAIYRSTTTNPHKGPSRFVESGDVKTDEALSYNYYLDMSPRQFFLPYRRWIRVTVSLMRSDEPNASSSGVSVHALYPSILDPSYLEFRRSPNGGHCPVVPAST